MKSFGLLLVNDLLCIYRKQRELEEQNRELLSSITKREDSIHQNNVCIETGEQNDRI